MPRTSATSPYPDPLPRLPPPKKRASAPPQQRAAEVRRRGFDTDSKATAALVDPDKPLTAMQKQFVKMWAQGESITSAAARAGYAGDSSIAYRMCHMPNILRAFDEEKRLYELACSMTRKKVMDGLLEGIEMAKLAGEPASMVAGWREIGRMCGYYEPRKVEVGVSFTGGAIQDRLNRMSDAELLKLITEDIAETADEPE